MSDIRRGDQAPTLATCGCHVIGVADEDGVPFVAISFKLPDAGPTPYFRIPLDQAPVLAEDIRAMVASGQAFERRN